MTYNQIVEKIKEGGGRIASITKEKSELEKTLEVKFGSVKEEAHLGTWFKTNSNGYVRIDDFTIETIIRKDGKEEYKIDKVHGIGFKAVETKAVTNISSWFTPSELVSINSAKDTLYDVLNTIYYVNNVYSD